MTNYSLDTSSYSDGDTQCCIDIIRYGDQLFDWCHVVRVKNYSLDIIRHSDQLVHLNPAVSLENCSLDTIKYSDKLFGWYHSVTVINYSLDTTRYSDQLFGWYHAVRVINAIMTSTYNDCSVDISSYSDKLVPLTSAATVTNWLRWHLSSYSDQLVPLTSAVTTTNCSLDTSSYIDKLVPLISVMTTTNWFHWHQQWQRQTGSIDISSDNDKLFLWYQQLVTNCSLNTSSYSNKLVPLTSAVTTTNWCHWHQQWQR